MKQFKRIAGLVLSATVVLTSMTAFAAGQITWQVKDYFTGDRSYAIAYEQYLDGVPTGLVVSGNEARQYGLKGWADSITHPVTWYDSSYPNLQYAEVWADGQYTGLVEPTGAQLPYTAYKDFRFMWEVGGSHKEVAETRARLGNSGDDAKDYIGGETYPKVYTGANADVLEENRYFGFDVFHVIGNGAARDAEVVLDKNGNTVNATNRIKAEFMTGAADENTISGSIAGLVNSGNGSESVLYKMLNNDLPSTYAGQRTDGIASVPVLNYTGFTSDYFDDKLPIVHSFFLSGPKYDAYGNIPYGSEYAVKIDTYADCVSESCGLTGACSYSVNQARYGFYTNNILTPHATARATADWVYAGYELAEPYRIYEYLRLEGVVFDGDIDNDGVLDTPVIFRYPTSETLSGAPNAALFDPAKTSYALANPKVEWKYAWVEASYPHEIMMQKFVEDMNGNMVPVNDFRGSGKYAKENLGAEIYPQDGVPSAHKHYQMRLDWRSNDGKLYQTPYFDVNEHASEYIELSVSPDPDYIARYGAVIPGTLVTLKPESIASVN